MPTACWRRATWPPYRPPRSRWPAVRCCWSHSISYLSPGGGTLPGRCALLGSVTNPAAAVSLVRGLQAQLTDQVGRQRGQRGALQQQRHGRFHTEVAANSVADTHRHKRIHAQLGQRLIGVERAALRVAHDGQDAATQSRDDDPSDFGSVHLAQRIGAGPIVVVAVDIELLSQLPEIAELLNLGERGGGP